MHLKTLEKQDQSKAKSSTWKVILKTKAEINEIQTNDTKEKNK